MHYFTPKRCETTTKIMYHDRQTAWQAAEQSRIERGVELWVYQCQYCGQWHLTHRDPALAQAVNRAAGCPNMVGFTEASEKHAVLDCRANGATAELLL